MTEIKALINMEQPISISQSSPSLITGNTLDGDKILLEIIKINCRKISQDIKVADLSSLICKDIKEYVVLTEYRKERMLAKQKKHKSFMDKIMKH